MRKNIEEICQELKVSQTCYEKVHDYLKRHNKCYICEHVIVFPTIETPDGKEENSFSSLRWIGDEQVWCCGEQLCEKTIKKLDLIHQDLREQSEQNEATQR